MYLHKQEVHSHWSGYSHNLDLCIAPASYMPWTEKLQGDLRHRYQLLLANESLMLWSCGCQHLYWKTVLNLSLLNYIRSALLKFRQSSPALEVSLIALCSLTVLELFQARQTQTYIPGHSLLFSFVGRNLTNNGNYENEDHICETWSYESFQKSKTEKLLV